MKIQYLYFSLFFLASCSSEIVQQVDNDSTIEKINVHLEDFKNEENSRTNIKAEGGGVHYAWAQTDTLGIFPSKGKQVEFPMADGAGSQSATFSGGGWGLKQSSYYAAYCPLVGLYYLDKTKIPVSYTGQIQEGNNSTSHLGKYDYLVAPNSEVKNGVVSFNFKRLGCVVKLEIPIQDPGIITSVTLSCDEPIFIEEGYLNLDSNSPRVISEKLSKNFTINLKNVTTTTENEKVSIYFMTPPLQLIGKVVKVMVMHNGIEYMGTVESKNMEVGTAYRLETVLEKKESVTTFHVTKAGTLSQLIGNENKFNISRLKITGEINGSDVFFIREMLGTGHQGQPISGSFLLKYLDLYDAMTVEGGSDYFYDAHPDDFMPQEYFTENNIIGKHMFDGCKQLETIILPKDITIIDDYAFHGCENLKTVTIPQYVQIVGKGAFGRCINLKTISLPQSLSIIGDIAFEFCNSLVSVQIPNQVTNMGYAFRFCDNLETVNLSDRLTHIKTTSFMNCPKLQNIHLPQDLVSIGVDAFRECSNLQSVQIPPRVELIESGVFGDCNILKIIVSQGMKKLHTNMFEGAFNCKSIILPKSIIMIERNSLPPHINDVYCFAEEPPIVEYALGIQHLYVPKGVVEKYKAANGWKDYAAKIFEMPDGIAEP